MPDIVQKTLNPLPNSILIPASSFTGSYIGAVKAPVGPGYPNVGYVWFGVSGDLTNDQYPEIVLTGWSVQPGSPSEAAPSPLYTFTTSKNGVQKIDATNLLGVNQLPGTSTPRILDLNKDGRNDFMYFGHNEVPLMPTISETFIQTSMGTFVESRIPGPRMASHNSNPGDFNGDGYTDFVASSYATDGSYFDKNLYLNLADGSHYGGLMTLFVNDKSGGFSPYALRYTKPSSQGWTLPDYFGGGAASAIADFDNDGKTEIVMVDVTPNTEEPKDPKWQRGDTFILRDIKFGDREAWGNLVKLPAPYLEDKEEFANLPFYSGKAHSHDIKVLPFDVNNDGLMDILVSSVNWSPSAGFYAGVMQVLLNQGGLKFVDVTDNSLYNYFLGKPSAHDPVMMDVNGDGFIDIIMPDAPGQMNAQAETIDKTWGNHILINAGNGKFVQAAWSELHSLTLQEKALAQGDLGLGGLQDLKLTPYMLPDGRLGFFAVQGGNLNGDPAFGFFDFRLNQALSTGPNGSDPASKGAPGYSEYYYLTQYPDVVAAINEGKYENGLDHYLKVGKANGYFAFAPNAAIHDSSSNDVMIGREGAETFYLGRGNDDVDGKDGNDTLVYSQSLKNYRISAGSNAYQIQDKSGVDGIDTIRNVETLKFSDFSINPTVKTSAKSIPASSLQKIEELYVAFFNRTPDADGLAYWISEHKKGMSIDKIAESFYAIGASPQFASLTGFSTSMSNTDFINLFYKNVLGRKDGADPGGLAYWNAKLSDGSSTRSSLASDILNAAHTFKGNKDYGWVADLLDNKILIANKIAVDWGLNFNKDAYSNGVQIAAAVSPAGIDNAIALIGLSPQDLFFG